MSTESLEVLLERIRIGDLDSAKRHLARALKIRGIDALSIPEGPERAALAHGRPVVLADGHRITPEMVHGPIFRGIKLAVVGDGEDMASNLGIKMTQQQLAK